MIVQENEPSRMILLDKGFDSLVQWLEQGFGSTLRVGVKLRDWMLPS